MDTDISIIIPCKNEFHSIGICLESLLNQKGCVPLEIIVVDNGSTDGTVQVLEQYDSKVKVLCLPGAPIACVRNFGAHHATGSWLAFIDADVEVSENWCVSFVDFVSELQGQGFDTTNMITGSRCLASEKPTWVERVWVDHLLMRDEHRGNYINSAHLIIHNSLFTAIGGFDSSFVTGEDEKLCLDAVMRGAVIRKAPFLNVKHLGYPKSLVEFFRRERWHGRGMERYLKLPWKCRDLILATFSWALVMIVFFSFFFMSTISFTTVVTCCLLFLSSLLLIAYSRSNKMFKSVVFLFIITLVYATAKMVALFDIFSSYSYKMIRDI